MKKIYLSGERPNPEEHNSQFLESIKKYNFAEKFSLGKDVLEIGCAFGYGVGLLSDKAKKIVGIDLYPEVTQEAKKKFNKKNTEFVAMDAMNLGFRDGSFDLICSFETIEHLKDQNRFIKEVARVLRPDGEFILSTPNNREMTKTNAPFHVREFNAQALTDVLKVAFKTIMILGM